MCSVLLVLYITPAQCKTPLYNVNKDDLDFNSFNLGNGRLNEKKKRLALYVSNIINDNKNVKNCNETIRRILDNR